MCAHGMAPCPLRDRTERWFAQRVYDLSECVLYFPFQGENASKPGRRPCAWVRSLAASWDTGLLGLQYIAILLGSGVGYLRSVLFGEAACSRCAWPACLMPRTDPYACASRRVTLSLCESQEELGALGSHFKKQWTLREPTARHSARQTAIVAYPRTTVVCGANMRTMSDIRMVASGVGQRHCTRTSTSLKDTNNWPGRYEARHRHHTRLEALSRRRRAGNRQAYWHMHEVHTTDNRQASNARQQCPHRATVPLPNIKNTEKSLLYCSAPC